MGQGLHRRDAQGVRALSRRPRGRSTSSSKRSWTRRRGRCGTSIRAAFRGRRHPARRWRCSTVPVRGHGRGRGTIPACCISTSILWRCRRSRSARCGRATGCAISVPDSGHLVHMPTHIDVLCGNYRDVVVYNQKAVVVDRKFLAREGALNVYAMYRSAQPSLHHLRRDVPRPVRRRRSGRRKS